MSLPSTYAKISAALALIARFLQPIFLLAIRLYWGWAFFQAGKGKLTHLDKTTEFFASLHLPMPKLNAIAAGGTECIGGLLLMLGLCSRLVSLPLIFTMVVAYLTAESDAVHAIFSKPDDFINAAPFLFLLVSLIVFLFGPGKLSLDALLFKDAETTR